jgi:hypothetical protein
MTMAGMPSRTILKWKWEGFFSKHFGKTKDYDNANHFKKYFKLCQLL